MNLRLALTNRWFLKIKIGHFYSFSGTGIKLEKIGAISRFSIILPITENRRPGLDISIIDGIRLGWVK